MAASAPARSAARMRAWRVHAYGAPRAELRLEHARVPPLRAPDDVLVRVAAASLNPLDVAMIGGYGARALNALRALEGAAGVEFPLVCGRDCAGTVLRAGPRARLRAGERVWAVVPPHRAGTHAQFVVVKDEHAGPAPSTLSDHEAAGALYAGLTACALLRAAGLPADGGAGGGAGGAGGAGGGAGGAGGAGGGAALLLGLGGVGQAALQLLARRGVEVTVGCSGELAELARRLGAARVLDRRAADYERQLDSGPPYEAVLDCAGLGGGAAGARRWRFRRYVTLSAPLLRRVQERGAAGGALCAGADLLAHCAAAAWAAPPASLSALAAPPHVRWAFFSARAADVALLRRLAERGQFGVCVERVFPWRRGADAYERAAAGGARGKLVLDFSAAPPAAQP